MSPRTYRQNLVSCAFYQTFSDKHPCPVKYNPKWYAIEETISCRPIKYREQMTQSLGRWEPDLPMKIIKIYEGDKSYD